MFRKPAAAALILALTALLFATPAAADDPGPPATTTKLIFIHHSVGENWLADGNGNLGITLRGNNYFVSDTNYGWGPADADVESGTIGDHTNIGHCGTGSGDRTEIPTLVHSTMNPPSTAPTRGSPPTPAAKTRS